MTILKSLHIYLNFHAKSYEIINIFVVSFNNEPPFV
jgi:hypothetical protein